MESAQNDIPLSRNAKAVAYATVRDAFAAGRMPDVINATIGIPDFDVAPSVKTAAKQAIDNGFNNYTESKGIFPLREAIAAYITRNYHIDHDPGAIVVTPGTSFALYLTLHALLNEGDEVIIIEPYFIAYPELVRMLGAVPVFVPSTRDFEPDLDALALLVSSKTKAIILNSPNNPSGVVYGRSTIERIIEIASSRAIPIVSDEIYRELVYEGEPASPVGLYKHAILIDGLSKSKSVTGWRIGYVAGPQSIIDAVEKLHMFTMMCAPSVFQHAAITALALPMDEGVIARYRAARDVIFDALKEYNVCVRPSGGFYFFLSMPVSGEEAVEDLLKQGLAVVPGRVFGERYGNYIRVSYARSEEEVKKMAGILKGYLGDFK